MGESNIGTLSKCAISANIHQFSVKTFAKLIEIDLPLIVTSILLTSSYKEYQHWWSWTILRSKNELFAILGCDAYFKS